MAINPMFTNKIVDYVFGGIPFNPPANYYLGVSIAPISEDGTGIVEPKDPNYERITITNDKANFSLANDGALSIQKEFRFNEAHTNWGNVVDYFLSDSETDDTTPLIFGHLQLTRNVEIGTTLVLSPNDFTIEMHTCEME